MVLSVNSNAQNLFYLFHEAINYGENYFFFVFRLSLPNENKNFFYGFRCGIVVVKIINKHVVNAYGMIKVQFCDGLLFISKKVQHPNLYLIALCTFSFFSCSKSVFFVLCQLWFKYSFLLIFQINQLFNEHCNEKIKFLNKLKTIIFHVNYAEINSQNI